MWDLITKNYFIFDDEMVIQYNLISNKMEVEQFENFLILINHLDYLKLYMLLRRVYEYILLNEVNHENVNHENVNHEIKTEIKIEGDRRLFSYSPLLNIAYVGKEENSDNDLYRISFASLKSRKSNEKTLLSHYKTFYPIFDADKPVLRRNKVLKKEFFKHPDIIHVRNNLFRMVDNKSIKSIYEFANTLF